MEHATEEDFERLRQNLRNAPKRDLGMTRAGADLEFFRNQPYPCTPEREAEIERLHRQQRKYEAEQHRARAIGFAGECVEGKHGRAVQELADQIFRTVEYADLIDRQGNATPENCSNLVLWDLRRRVAWMSARARGELVPEKLKSREECLAIYNARKFDDERWADNEVTGTRPAQPQAHQPPPPRPAPREPEQQTIGDWAREAYP